MQNTNQRLLIIEGQLVSRFQHLSESTFSHVSALLIGSAQRDRSAQRKGLKQHSLGQRPRNTLRQRLDRSEGAGQHGNLPVLCTPCCAPSGRQDIARGPLFLGRCPRLCCSSLSGCALTASIRAPLVGKGVESVRSVLVTSMLQLLTIATRALMIKGILGRRESERHGSN